MNKYRVKFSQTVVQDEVLFTVIEADSEEDAKKKIENLEYVEVNPESVDVNDVSNLEILSIEKV